MSTHRGDILLILLIRLLGKTVLAVAMKDSEQIGNGSRSKLSQNQHRSNK